MAIRIIPEMIIQSQKSAPKYSIKKTFKNNAVPMVKENSKITDVHIYIFSPKTARCNAIKKTAEKVPCHVVWTP